jgi:transposase
VNLHGFFDPSPRQSLSSLRFSCTDIWCQYVNVIASRASSALQIFDRFHLMKKLNVKIDEVRADKAPRLKEQGRGEVLNQPRWCLLKNTSNLIDR